MKKAKRPKKSIAELQAEIDALKKAKESVQNYEKLERERAQLKRDIRKEGFKLKHRRTLSIINRAQSLSKKTYASATSPKAKKTYKKTFKALKKEMKKL